MKIKDLYPEKLLEHYADLSQELPDGSLIGYEVDISSNNLKNWLGDHLPSQSVQSALDAISDHKIVAVLKNIWVDVDNRNQGTGSALMQSFLDQTTASVILAAVDIMEQQIPGWNIVRWYTDWGFEDFGLKTTDGTVLMKLSL